MNETDPLTAPISGTSPPRMDLPRVAVVIEDDADVRDAVLQLLRSSGFQAHPAPTGREGVASVRQHTPAVVILDLTLPDIDGFEVARQIRGFSSAYIVILTARTGEIDTLLGFEAGADDYITKPFRPRELRARIGALLRRTPQQQATPAITPATTTEPVPQAVAGPRPASNPEAGEDRRLRKGSGTLEHNGLFLHPPTRSVWADGSQVQLTRAEFDVLSALIEHGRTVLSKTRLARVLRYREYDTGALVSQADERVIEVHIGNLRRKIGDHPRHPRWIETVRGIGYRLTPTRQRAHDRPATGPALVNHGETLDIAQEHTNDRQQGTTPHFRTRDNPLLHSSSGSRT